MPMRKFLLTKRGHPDRDSWLVLQKEKPELSDLAPVEVSSIVQFVENLKNCKSIKKKQSVLCSKQ